jgi:hypothetical protein
MASEPRAHSAYLYIAAVGGDARSCRFARTTVAADNPESPARGTGEIKTRSASALLEQYEACFGQHPLLPRGQAATGLPSRQVADYLNDLDQIP